MTDDVVSRTLIRSRFGMKVLICDDHALFREGVMVALRDMADGIELFEASNGAEALDLASQRPDLDLVLLDLQMPGTDGWTGLARIRERCPSLPIVIPSASEDPHDARRAIEAGAEGFIPKSTQGPVLWAALSLVLSGGIYLPRTRSPGKRRKRSPRRDPGPVPTRSVASRRSSSKSFASWRAA